MTLSVIGKVLSVFVVLGLFSMFNFSCKKDSVSNQPATGTLYPVLKDGHWGFIDKEGRIVIPAMFKALPSSQELLKVSGFPDEVYTLEHSSIVIPSASQLSEDEIKRLGILVDKRDIYDAKNDIAYIQNLRPPFTNFKGNLKPFIVPSQNESSPHQVTIGYLDRVGDIKIPDEYTLAGDFVHGIALVSKNGAMSYINENNEMAIDTYEYSQILPFSEDGLAAVKKDDKFGFIDLNGELVIRNVYDGVGLFNEGYVLVERNGKSGIINSEGELIIPIDYILKPPSDDMVAFQVDDDESENDALWGFMDIEGNEVIYPQYLQVLPFSEGFALVTNGTHVFYIDKTNTELASPEIDGGLVFNEGFAAVRKGALWGFINKRGVMVIPPRFDWASSFESGVAMVVNNGKIGYIDTKGSYIWEPAN